MRFERLFLEKQLEDRDRRNYVLNNKIKELEDQLQSVKREREKLKKISIRQVIIENIENEQERERRHWVRR